MFAIETKDLARRESHAKGYNRPRRIKAWSREFKTANASITVDFKPGEVSYLQHKDAAMRLAVKIYEPGKLPTHWHGGQTATGWVWVAV